VGVRAEPKRKDVFTSSNVRRTPTWERVIGQGEAAERNSRFGGSISDFVAFLRPRKRRWKSHDALDARHAVRRERS
jgi:hypothetical protein